MARAVLARIDADGLVERARDNGTYLGERLAELVLRHPKSTETSRGLGLLRALVLKPAVDARKVLESLRSAGVLLTLAGGTALRFSPALNIEKSEIDEGIALVDSVLTGIDREL